MWSQVDVRLSIRINVFQVVRLSRSYDVHWHSRFLYLSPFMLFNLYPTLERTMCAMVRPVHLLFCYISSLWTLPHPRLTFNPPAVPNPLSNNVFDICARCSAQRHPQTRPGSSCRALLPLPCRHSYFTLPFQYPDRPEVITENILKLTELAPDPCVYLIYMLFHFCTLKRPGG